jgi:hypothetical protein
MSVRLGSTKRLSAGGYLNQKNVGVKSESSRWEMATLQLQGPNDTSRRVKEGLSGVHAKSMLRHTCIYWRKSGDRSSLLISGNGTDGKTDLQTSCGWISEIQSKIFK